MHYTQQDIQQNKQELNKKGLCFLAALLLYLAASIYFVIARQQFACTLFSLVILPGIFFCFAVYLLPPLRYARFLRDVFEARRHEHRFTFTHFEPDLNTRDGVSFYPMIVTDDEGFEHRLYWDSQKPLPTLTQGQQITVTTFGQSIVELE